MASGGSASAPRSRSSSRSPRFPLWVETLLLLVVALVVSLLVKTFLVQMFFVPSASMRPQFVEDDRILVQKVSYWGGDVERGDVVVFSDPGGRWLGTDPEAGLTGFQKVLSTVGLYPSGGHLVKRVVGVGGDRVACCDKAGRVTVNGVPLAERPYLLPGTKPSERTFDVRVPEGRLWVMGDNRANSEDSRYHQDLPGKGTISEEDVVGKVWSIVWPFSRAELLDEPETFQNPRLR